MMTVAAKQPLKLKLKQKASIHFNRSANIRLIKLAINTGYSNPPHFSLITNSSIYLFMTLVLVYFPTYIY